MEMLVRKGSENLFLVSEPEMREIIERSLSSYINLLKEKTKSFIPENAMSILNLDRLEIEPIEDNVISLSMKNMTIEVQTKSTD